VLNTLVSINEVFLHRARLLLGWVTPVAVLGWGQGGTGPPNLAQAPQTCDWFRSALFLLEGF